MPQRIPRVVPVPAHHLDQFIKDPSLRGPVAHLFVKARFFTTACACAIVSFIETGLS